MGLITDATVRSLPARWKRDSIFASGVYLSAADPGIFRRSKSTRQMSVGRSSCCSVRLMNGRSEEHTSELQSLMRISYAVFCLKKKQKKNENHTKHRKPHYSTTKHNTNAYIHKLD